MERAYTIDNQNGLLTFGLTLMYEMAGRYAAMVPFLERLLELEPEKTHFAVQARYFQFLADGKLESWRALEQRCGACRAPASATCGACRTTR